MTVTVPPPIDDAATHPLEACAIAGECAVRDREHAIACVVDAAAVGEGAIAREGAAGDHQRPGVEDAAGIAEEGAVRDRQRAAAGDATVVATALGDGQVLDREVDASVHGEDAHAVPAAGRDQTPAINGGVSANGLRAGDGNRGGAPAVEGYGAVETPAAWEAGIQRCLGAACTRASAHDARPGARG